MFQFQASGLCVHRLLSTRLFSWCDEYVQERHAGCEHCERRDSAALVRDQLWR